MNNMKLLSLAALLAVFHGIQSVPMGPRGPPIRTPMVEKSDKVLTPVAYITEGTVNIIKSFNQMGDSLKRQARDAMSDFQKKLDETTIDIAKKFQEHKEKFFKSKHGVTLTNLSELVAQKNTKIQGNVRQVMNELNKKMKEQLEKTKTHVKGLEKKLADNFHRTMDSFQSSFSTFFDTNKSA